MTGSRDTGEAESLPGRALLLRVGMDRGTGGALGPIFSNGTFEYMPIPEYQPTRCKLTYASMPGQHVASLAEVLPPRLALLHPHIDPDFETATYGDAAPRKRRQLAHLAPGDKLVFYAGLVPRPRGARPRLFAIGWLAVSKVHCLRAHDIADSGLRNRFGRTAHFLREPPDEDLVLVEGERAKSRLFSRARPLGDADDCLLRDLAPLGYHGSLRRAVGHWLAGPDSLQFLDAWLERGPASLVGQRARLVPVPAAAVQAAGEGGTLLIAAEKLRDGDWVLSLSPGQPVAVQALARVNQVVSGQVASGQVASGECGPLAQASLFWSFAPGSGVVAGGFLLQYKTERTICDTAEIRALVAWFDARYRVGFHDGSEVAPGATLEV